MTGRVVKGIGGFYFVHDGARTVMGKARGNLKRNKELIYVGDIVEYDIDTSDGDNECIIAGVSERRNYLMRPPVSNLDVLVVMFALRDPEVNYPVTDKLLAGAERAGIRPVVCITKKDLADPDELERAVSVYRGVYPVTAVNGSTGEGVRELAEMIRGCSAALAGPSGVGKSTLTSVLIRLLGGDRASEDEGFVAEAGEDISEGSCTVISEGARDRSGRGATSLRTGRVSDKTGRGRHTTRHVEIFPLVEDTYLYDTPGFTSLDLIGAEPRDIANLMPEFREAAGSCRYSDCIHINEPDCGVKTAVDEGRIHRSRYSSYKMMVEEALRNRR